MWRHLVSVDRGNAPVAEKKELKMKFKQFFVLSLFLSVGILQNSAHARTQEEVERDLAKVADTAVAAYKEQGMLGLIIKTEECYERNIKKPLDCVYLDLASRRIDQVFVETMYFPPSEFFADEQFGPRIFPVLVSANMDMNTANQFLASITPVINNLVEKKLLGKK